MIATQTEMLRFVEALKQDNNRGRIFEVTFRKRTDGSIRSMTCRLGVTSYLAGGTLRFDPKKLKLLTVFDMQKQAYRSIALDAIVSARINGITYTVE